MRKINRYWLGTFVLLGLLAAAMGCTVQGTGAQATAPLPPQERLRVATTTSLYDTGLWGYLEPMFEEEYDTELDILSAGTGIALEYGRRGDVDVITITLFNQTVDFFCVFDGFTPGFIDIIEIAFLQNFAFFKMWN